MQLVITEDQQAHLYSCLLDGGQEFGKVKKSLAKLDREDAKIDAELALNSELRTIFNPRAEEEARAAERAKRGDADQMTIGDELGAGYADEDTTDGRMAHAEVASTRTPHDEKATVDEALADEEEEPALVAERAD